MGFVPQGVKKASDNCFVSHNRWANASTHDHFQRKPIRDLNIPPGFILKTQKKA